MKTEYQFENTDNSIKIELYNEEYDQKHPSFTVERNGVYRLTIINPTIKEAELVYFANVNLIKIFINSIELVTKIFDTPVKVNIARTTELAYIYIYQ